MRPLGDRRAHIRLEVVGALWGTLEFSEPTRVVNISATGAMIESPVPVARDSMQPLSLVVDGESLVINAPVRYMHRVTQGGGPATVLYRGRVRSAAHPARPIDRTIDIVRRYCLVAFVLERPTSPI